jgi:hypothetical protein
VVAGPTGGAERTVRLVGAANDRSYDVPLEQVERYRSYALIIRAATAESLVPVLEDAESVAIDYVRLPATVPTDTLLRRAEGLPVELRLIEPDRDYPQLYRQRVLLEDHPVRVSVPGTAEAEPALKLALSLGFAVHLQVGPSGPDEMAALRRMLDRYLHHGGTNHPVEPFHSLLLHHLGRCEDDLWAIQESDPARIVHVTEAGSETLPGQLAAAPFEPDARFLDRFKATLQDRGTECSGCPHFPSCGGFFKWPDPNYSCVEVKGVLDTIRLAAAELRTDLTAFERLRGESP